MYAAHGHHEIVDKLVVARAGLNTKNKYECARPLGPSGGVVGRRLCRLHLFRPAGTQRCT
jgi:hypothetical protein